MSTSPNVMFETSRIKIVVLFIGLVWLAPLSLLSQQQVFDRKVTTVGNIGMSITNTGVIGKPDVRNDPAGDPSMEYPLDSGTEHLFEAGIWIGVVRDGANILVSTAARTDPAGYAPGKSGYEFTNDGSLIAEYTSLAERSADAIFVNADSVSHQEYITFFSDKRTVIEQGGGGLPIANHTQPLFADIMMKSKNWNFAFTENFSLLEYKITNNSNQRWDSVYIGMYADIVVRNINTTLDQGGEFFNKGGFGYLDSTYTIYAFDAGSNDSPAIKTYGAITLLGAEYRGDLFHDSNREFLEAQGKQAPGISPSYWLFSAGAGDFAAPADDLERYQKMANKFPMDEDGNRNTLRTGGRTSNGNFISFISMGPFPEIEPGESITVYFAFSAALMPEEFQPVPNRILNDNTATRAQLDETVDWIYRTFQGEDTNGNGVLDAGEDLNGNSVLDRYLIPEPPQTPQVQLQLDAGKVTLYWNDRSESSVDPVSGLQDFEGYRVYRTDLGDDIRGTITTSSRLIQQWDLPGNSAGFNNGFSSILLDDPVTIDGVEYKYSYEIEGLLSGWQYQFSVTAFDSGDDEIDLPSLESNPNATAIRVFPGTAPNENFESDEDEFKVGVYPNPYRVNAAWDGGTSFSRKVIFYNLPQRAEIRVYTLAGEIVADLNHDAATYQGDIRWFQEFSSNQRVLSGGEHAWDILSQSNQNLTTGLYLFSVKDLDSGKVQTGKLAIIK